MGPPVGGTFWFQIFIQASSPEIWSETISGGEEVLAGKMGWPVLGYLLGKNFRRHDRDHLVPPRRMDAAVCRTECAILSVGSTEGRWQRPPRFRPAGLPKRTPEQIEDASGFDAREPQAPLDGSCPFLKTLAGVGSALWSERLPSSRRQL